MMGWIAALELIIIFIVIFIYLRPAILLIFFPERDLKERKEKLEREYKQREKDLEIKFLRQENILRDKLHTMEQNLTYSLNQTRAKMLDAINKEIDLFKESKLSNAKEILEQKIKDLDTMFKEKENYIKEKFLADKQMIEAAQVSLQENLVDLKKQERAAIDARIREYEEKHQESFYSIILIPDDLLDIEQLHSISPSLRNPVPLYKAMFSIYYRPAVNDLINRITGGKRISGIYKITLIETGQCYIGQSVDIGNRWMQHCKRGAGVDKPTGIKLYPAMQEHGIHNFRFEIIEEVENKRLSEREKYWGSYFGAKLFGYSIKN